MNETDAYRRNYLRRRAIEFTVSFVIVLAVAVGLIGIIASKARAGIGCTVKSIAVSPSHCGGLTPGPAAHAPAEVRVVFEEDSPSSPR